MKKLLIVVLLLAVAVGAVGYWRGWFSVSSEGIQTDAEKFKKDKAAFSNTVSEKARAVKNQVANLWKKSEGLTDDDKKELGELQKKHDRLEQQIKELDEAGPDRFESIKQDLTKNLEEVERKIEELTKKLKK
jgi:gas vesicle protein